MTAAASLVCFCVCVCVCVCFFCFAAHEVKHITKSRIFIFFGSHCTHHFGFAFLRAFQRNSVFKRQVGHKIRHRGSASPRTSPSPRGSNININININNVFIQFYHSFGFFGTQPLQIGQRHAGGSFPLAITISCDPNQCIQVNFQQAKVPHLGDVADFYMQFRVFTPQHG
ncbi:MAG: hypothetical protein EBU84_00885 [Actinobacteria bacterium]|nr:hypothetical protein [Actinomycetota bacterium]